MDTHSRPGGRESVRPTLGSGLLLVYGEASPAERARVLGLSTLRTLVGLLDLLLAGAIYTLFVLLQGRAPAHHLWWTPHSIVAAAAIAAALIVSRSLLEIVSIHCVVAYVQNRYIDLALRLTRGYTEMRWTAFAGRNRGELLNTTINTAREASFFSHLGIEMTASVLVVAAMTAALVYQSLTAACGLLVMVGLFWVLHRFLLRHTLRDSALRKEQASGHLQRIISDLFSSGKEIRTYANQAFFYRRVRDQADSLSRESLRLMVLPQIAKLLADQGVMLLFLGFVVILELRHGDIHRMISLLVFYFVLSRRLLPLISQISFMAGQMEASFASLRVVRQELLTCELEHAPAMAVSLPSSGFVLEIDTVSFAFNSRGPMLRRIHLGQRAAEVILIHGRSGSGKTSLLNLVAGIYTPASGTIRVDRQRVAYVTQEIMLLDDTVRNNLLFGSSPRSDAELMATLATAELGAFIKALPEGLDTRVGDNGIRFSGGQRQRLGLARAILRDPTLLLLDEATAALDEQSEARILDNLRGRGLAVLLVTHRAHTRRFGDRTLHLHNGELIPSPNATVSAVLVGAVR